MHGLNLSRARNKMGAGKCAGFETSRCSSSLQDPGILWLHLHKVDFHPTHTSLRAPPYRDFNLRYISRTKLALVVGVGVLPSSVHQGTGTKIDFPRPEKCVRFFPAKFTFYL